LWPVAAFAGCANYEDGSMPGPAPRAILCYKGKCDDTTLSYECGNMSGIKVGYANGLFIDVNEKGTVFSNKYNKMPAEDWTCKELTKNSCTGFQTFTPIVTSDLAENQHFTISGSAFKALTEYFSAKEECPADPSRTDCTFGSSVIDIQGFEGNFPGDARKFLVVFVSFDSGGSGAGLSAIVLRADDWAEYRIIGSVGVFGEDPRQVRFNSGRRFSYTGTVMGPNDTHANPTGSQRFELKIGDSGVAFSSDGVHD
jgi:hypothetical protein